MLYARVEPGSARVGPPPSAEPAPLEAPRPRAPSLKLVQLDDATRASVAVFSLIWVGLTVLDRRRGAGLAASSPA
jgi:hypothetical protein